MYNGTLNITTTQVSGTLTINETVINSQLEVQEATFVSSLTTAIKQKDVIDIDSEDNKANKWVIGKGVPTLLDGGAFLGFSLVAQPTLEEHFNPILAAK